MTCSYHGVTVTEDYRWLEDATSEQTHAWTTAQHARTVTSGALVDTQIPRVNARDHGGQSLDETAAELTDVYTLLFDRLGVHYQPIEAS